MVAAGSTLPFPKNRHPMDPTDPDAMLKGDGQRCIPWPHGKFSPMKRSPQSNFLLGSAQRPAQMHSQVFEETSAIHCMYLLIVICLTIVNLARSAGLPACLIGRFCFRFCSWFVPVPLFSCCAFLLRLNKSHPPLSKYYSRRKFRSETSDNMDS